MYRYKRLLVAQNLTHMDKPVVRYAALISQMAKSEEIYYIHVNQYLDVPKEVLKEHPELISQLDGSSLEKMQETDHEYFNGHSEIKRDFKVIKGSPLKIILKHIIDKDIDLILTGRKKDPHETRRLPVRMVRKAPCSVLLVPDETEPSLSKILVPVDFSEHSAKAMEIAVAFAAAKGISDIQCLHVFHLPMGHYSTGKTDEEFTEIMKKNAQKEYQRFISGIDLKGVSATPEFVLSKKPAKIIKQVIEREKIDLLVIGAQGRNAGAGVLLGIVTEDLLLSTQVPLMAVKKKGSGMNFLEALFKL